VWALGCSGGDSVNFQGTDGDASVEGGDSDATAGDGSTDGGGAEGGDAAIPCPTYSGNDGYCKALVSYCQRCSPTLAGCEVDNFANCEKYSAAFSKAGRADIVTCLGRIACAANPSAALDRCVKDRLPGDTPTAAQDKLKVDVCTQCFPADAGLTACETDFWAKPDGGAGSGSFLLEWNDAINAQIDTTCASFGPADGGDGSGSLACATKALVCAVGIIGSSVPKDACKDGGG
jgi:hypothetical protein